MAAQLTKAQLQVLRTLRGTLRQVRQQYDNRALDGAETRDVSGFTRFVMQQYREGSKVTDRSRAKVLKQQGKDFLAYLDATRQQQELVSAYRGVDPDKPVQRQAAARLVGLTMPESVPVSSSASDKAAKYDLASKLAALEAAADFSQLTGVDNMKAQYYGLEAATGAQLGKGPSSGGSKAPSGGASPSSSNSKKADSSSS